MLFAVGSYTHSDSPAPDPRGRGISIFEWDESTGEGRLISEYTEIRNPSWLSWNPVSRMLYAVSEVEANAGTIAAFSLDDSGGLIFSGQQEGPGRAGCHLALTHNPERLWSASYGDGQIQVYPLDNGRPGPSILTHSYHGRGPVTERQSSPHAHQVLPGSGGRFLYAADLGSDTVWIHSVDNPEQEAPAAALKLPPGSGPRHLAMDTGGGYAYVLCELRPVLYVCSIDSESGELRILQELVTADPQQREIAAPAAVKLHPSGKTLVVSSRFDDTISVFFISRGGAESVEGLALSLADRFPCRGKTPRDITFSPGGRQLFIANQDSYNISCRNFDPSSGLPGEGWAGEVSTESPACIVML